MAKTLTRTDLAERGLDAIDKSKHGDIAVSRQAGGVSFATAMEVIEFAKLMAVSGKAVPLFLRNNPGGCLAITFQAVGWQMDPFQVANKSYEVNDRVGFESQLIHGVIEARAPLTERLNCTYSGEGPERRCRVYGRFIGDSADREYISPPLKDISRQNAAGEFKGSPLWRTDPDQQLFYYASRAFCRRWAPDVIMGIYTREELKENPTLGREDEPPAPGFVARLVQGGADRPAEGHADGHADAELAQLQSASRHRTIESVDHVETTPQPTIAKRKPGRPAKPGPKVKDKAKRASGPAKAEPPPAAKAPADPNVKRVADRAEHKPEAPKPPPLPKTVAAYVDYATAWINAAASAEIMEQRWNDERTLRNNLGMVAEDRVELQNLILDRREKFGSEK